MFLVWDGPGRLRTMTNLCCNGSSLRLTEVLTKRAKTKEFTRALATTLRTPLKAFDAAC